MRQGLVDYRATGSEGFRPIFLASLAEGCRAFGQIDHGLIAINEALTITNTTGEGLYEAELFRLRGELLSMGSASNRQESERCYRTAVEVSRRQRAKAWELRATTSLAHLLRDTGRRDQARAMLADILRP